MSYLKRKNNVILELQDVTHSFRHNGKAETILQNLSVKVNRNEFVSLLAMSGIGKSTYLRIQSGLIEPQQGLVTFDGKSINFALRDKRFGYVFQRSFFARWRTVLQNVFLPLEITETLPNGAHQIDRALTILKQVGLENEINKFPDQLSGGQQQRLSLAMTLVYRPEVWFFDEALGALDSVTRRSTQKLLLKIWNEIQPQNTVLFVTHDIIEALLMADRVLIFNRKPISTYTEIFVPFKRPRDFSIIYSNEFKSLAEQAHSLMETPISD